MILFRSVEELPTSLSSLATKEGPTLSLRPEEKRHIKARRLRPGAELLLSDGRGRSIQARLLPNWELLLEEEKGRMPPPPKRILATALPEGRRWDWLLQKSAELGTTHIWPLHTERSQRHSYSHKRSQRILEEACSQSRNLYLPLLSEPRGLKELFQEEVLQKNQPRKHNDNMRLFLLAPGRGELLSFDNEAAKTDMAFFIGPEGGFSKKEEEFLIEEAGAEAWNLGHRILRIETAALTVLARSLA